MIRIGDSTKALNFANRTDELHVHVQARGLENREAVNTLTPND